MTRVLAVAFIAVLVLAMGFAEHGDPLLGLAVALLGGIVYYLGYVDGSAGR